MCIHFVHVANALLTYTIRKQTHVMETATESRRERGCGMAMAYKCYDSVVSSKWIRWNYKFVSVCVCWAMKSEWGEWARAQPAVDIKKSTMLYHPTSNASQNTAFILNRRITKKDEREEDMDKVNHFGKLAHSVLWRFVAWFCRSPSPYTTLISPTLSASFSFRPFRRSH